MLWVIFVIITLPGASASKSADALLPLDGNGRRWTWTRNFFNEIPGDFSPFFHRSGRSWTSLNVLEWWAVGDSDCSADSLPNKT
jgi:hypothetical protein